jgi:hypothetical protein
MQKKQKHFHVKKSVAVVVCIGNDLGPSTERYGLNLGSQL